MTSPTPPPIYNQAPQNKSGTKIIVWILLGIAACIFVGGLVLVGGMMYFVKKVKDSGNPAMAVAKIVTAMNPDLEVLSTDEETNTVRVRMKSTGEEVRLNLNDLQMGKIEISTKDGNVRIGGKSKAPDWVPIYPTMKGRPMTQVESRAKGEGTVVYQSDDNASAVAAYYDEQLKERGFTVERVEGSEAGHGAVVLKAESGAKTLKVVIAGAASMTVVTLVYSLESVN